MKQEERLLKLENAFKGVKLSSREKRTIKWLSTWDDDTVNNLISAIKKVGGGCVHTDLSR